MVAPNTGVLTDALASAAIDVAFMPVGWGAQEATGIRAGLLPRRKTIGTVFISERPAARIVVVLAMPKTRTPGQSTSASVRMPEAAVTM
jgi:hypothetical protein